MADHFELAHLCFYAVLGWTMVSAMCLKRSCHLDGTLSTNSSACLVRLDFRLCLYMSKIVHTVEFLLLRDTLFWMNSQRNLYLGWMAKVLEQVSSLF